jgi:hypothetical protein
MTYVVIYLTLMGIGLVFNYALNANNPRDDENV